MKAALLLLGVAVTVAACDREAQKAPTKAAASNFVSASAPGGIVPGAHVLVPFGPMFVEAEVDRVSGLRVGTKQGKTYDAADVVALPATAERSALSAGQPVLARTAKGLWTPTTIEKVDGDHYVVATEKHHRLARSDLLTPPKKVELELRGRLATDRLRSVAQSRVPYRPKGWAPKAGDAVLYRTRLDGGRWFAGTIAEAREGAYRVSSRIHRIDTWFGPELIAPLPRADGPTPEIGDYVLLEPEMRNWTFARVARSDGRFLFVRTEDGGEERTTAAGVLALVPRTEVWLPSYSPKSASTLRSSVLFEELLRQLGVTAHELRPDGMLELRDAHRRLLSAKYELVLHFGPLSGYTMAWKNPDSRPYVSEDDAKGPAKDAAAVEHQAFVRAVSAADKRHAPLVYVASDWYVALRDVHLSLPQSELPGDLSSEARALLATFAEPPTVAAAGGDRAAPTKQK
ncbi:MAG: hypothetical protein KC776_03985 [Myxococcales bacterium]|nr:hypothetical protein [Myxococcales bacterium]MCB9580156.1 hypothetical protein [Polyangiaceae bacterium]